MTQTKPRHNLGRLTSFGIHQPWQVALLLPQEWDDLREPLEDFSVRSFSGKVCVRGALDGDLSVKFNPGPPRLSGYLKDSLGNKLGFHIFGDSRDTERFIKSHRSQVTLYGQIEVFNDRLWLKNPEPVDPRWVGYLRPRYPGKRGVVGPELVLERVMEHLESGIPVAASFLADELKEIGTPDALCDMLGLRGWTFEQLLWQAHLPNDFQYGEAAQKALEQMAAFGMLLKAKRTPPKKYIPAPTPVGNWRRGLEGIPFRLTSEQVQAIEEIIADIAAPEPMRRALLGDVGTGKSPVIYLCARAVVEEGGLVYILLPNETLALQMAEEIRKWWPRFPLSLVTGDHPGNLEAPLLIGTTALLHRGLAPPNLLIIDEQQKMGVAQREKLLGPHTNHLEVSATCIPRSLALIRYGVVKVSTLRESHCRKEILTRIWGKEQWRELFAEVKQTVADGGQVLLIYPMREPGEKESPLRSAEEIFAIWDKLCPGQVRCVHGQSSSAEKEAVIGDMRDGRANYMISTSLVEVGINIPGLRRAVVAHPERFGLTTLHQIRGRLARLGGEGFFDLYLPYPVKDTTMQRLRVLEETTDGFVIAEQDLRLRGAGNISNTGTQQSGADETFLFGRPVRLEALDRAMDFFSY